MESGTGKGGGAPKGPRAWPPTRLSFTSLISQVLTSAPVGGASGAEREGGLVLTQGKMPIFGQFLPHDVSAGRAPFREPPPTLPGKGPWTMSISSQTRKGAMFLGLGMSQDTAKPRTFSELAGWSALSPWGQHKCLVHTFVLRGNDTLSMGRGCGLSAFDSFPVILSLADNLSVVSPNDCSVNIAEFVLAGKRARHAPLPFGSRFLLIQSISL